MKKTYISFSGGVESRTMAILYGKGATLIFCDTGSEHEELYKSIDHFEQWVKNFHKGDIELLRIKPDNTLEEEIIRKKFMPSPTKRFCTATHKIKVIDRFLRNAGECKLMIGLNADEDRKGNLEELPNVEYCYPLKNEQTNFPMGLNRDECEEMLKFYGVHPTFPPYMARGGCKFCFFKSPKEYKAMFHLNRTEFDTVLNLEIAIQDKKKKYFGIIQGGKSIAQIARESEEEERFLHADDFKDLYKETSKKTYCGLFCHR